MEVGLNMLPGETLRCDQSMTAQSETRNHKVVRRKHKVGYNDG